MRTKTGGAVTSSPYVHGRRVNLELTTGKPSRRWRPASWKRRRQPRCRLLRPNPSLVLVPSTCPTVPFLRFPLPSRTVLLDLEVSAWHACVSTHEGTVFWFWPPSSSPQVLPGQFYAWEYGGTVWHWRRMAVRPVEPGEEEPVLGQCRVRAVGEQAGKTAAAVGAPFQSSMEWSCRNQPRKWAKLPNFPFGLSFNQ